MENKGRDNEMFIIEDWNSQIGMRKRGEVDTMGLYGFGKRNESGWNVIRFYRECK